MTGIMLSSVIANIAAQTSPDEYLRFIKKSQQQHKSSDVIEASRKLQRTIPFRESSYFYEAMAFTDLQQYWNAIESYNRVLDINPKLVNGRINRSVAYGYVGDDNMAMKDLKAVEDIDPDNLMLLNNRACIYLRMGDVSNFVADIERATSLKNSSAESYINLGNYYKLINDFDKALWAADKAIEINPNSATAHLLRAEARYAKNEKSSLIAKDCKKAISLSKKRPKTLHEYAKTKANKAKAYMIMNNSKKAIQLYTEALTHIDKMIVVYPSTYMLHYHKGEIYQSMKLTEKAKAAFEKVLEINPNNFQAKQALLAL